VPAAVTVMQLVIAPVLHRYVLPVTTAAQREVGNPGQIVLLPVMVHTGPGFTVTVLLQVLLHPLFPVTVTE